MIEASLRSYANYIVLQTKFSVIVKSTSEITVIREGGTSGISMPDLFEKAPQATGRPNGRQTVAPTPEPLFLTYLGASVERVVINVAAIEENQLAIQVRT